MIYCFDLDDTLCITNKEDYNESKPIKERIKKVNELYKNGHTIIIDTARGSITKKNWKKTTEKQLTLWGVKYHKLRCGVKIAADIYIDDKAVRDKDFF